jgi:hypothetical protein
MILGRFKGNVPSFNDIAQIFLSGFAPSIIFAEEEQLSDLVDLDSLPIELLRS